MISHNHRSAMDPGPGNSFIQLCTTKSIQYHTRDFEHCHVLIRYLVILAVDVLCCILLYNQLPERQVSILVAACLFVKYIPIYSSTARIAIQIVNSLKGGTTSQEKASTIGFILQVGPYDKTVIAVTKWSKNATFLP